MTPDVPGVLPLGTATCRCAAGYLLETPCIRRYSFLSHPLLRVVAWAVKIRPVRAISRKGQVSSSGSSASSTARAAFRSRWSAMRAALSAGRFGMSSQSHSGHVTTGARTPRWGVRVRVPDREHPERQPSGAPSPLLREAAVGSAPPGCAVLRRKPTDHRETPRLRTVRRRPPVHGRRRSPNGGRVVDDCSLDRADESPAAVSVSGILRGHTPAISADAELKIWS